MAASDPAAPNGISWEAPGTRSMGSSAGGASGSSSPKMGLGKHQVSWRRPKQPSEELLQQACEAAAGNGKLGGDAGVDRGQSLQQQQWPPNAGLASACVSSPGTPFSGRLEGYGQQDGQQLPGYLQRLSSKRRSSSSRADAEGGPVPDQLAAAVLAREEAAAVAPHRREASLQEGLGAPTACHTSMQGPLASTAMTAAVAAGAMGDLPASAATTANSSSSRRSSCTGAGALTAVGTAAVPGTSVDHRQLQQESRAVSQNVLLVVSGLLQRG
jgi:hypothetical protein